MTHENSSGYMGYKLFAIFVFFYVMQTKRPAALTEVMIALFVNPSVVSLLELIQCNYFGNN